GCGLNPQVSVDLVGVELLVEQVARAGCRLHHVYGELQRPGGGAEIEMAWVGLHSARGARGGLQRGLYGFGQRQVLRDYDDAAVHALVGAEDDAADEEAEHHHGDHDGGDDEAACANALQVFATGDEPDVMHGRPPFRAGPAVLRYV